MSLPARAALLLAMLLPIGVMAARADSVAPPSAVADARAALGRRLFYDADLSIDGTMACATCHVQRRGFADSTRTHPGATGEPGRRNVPGLANVGRRASLTWGDAGLRTLEAQALVPLLGEHPVEMAMRGQEAELARRLGGNGCYVALFRAAFPEAEGRIDIATVTQALGAFQRTLVSSAAPIDRHRAGDADALPPQARIGETLFRRGCASCHGGADMTDDRFHRVADDRGPPGDRGLGEITGRARDDGRFRTPSLRNVAVSAPYFHDGASPTLADAIRRHRGMALADGELAALTAFLETMTDAHFLSDPRFAYPDGPCEG